MFRFADDHKEAAKVGVHTSELTEYPYTTKPNIIFCDLPGYGGPQYPDSKSYWNTFELGKFDGFLLFTKSERKEFDEALAEHIRSIKTPFFVVCTHVDRNEEEQLQIIKKNIAERISCKKEVFLINNNDPNSHDFYHLIEALMDHNMDPSPEGNCQIFVYPVSKKLPPE